MHDSNKKQISAWVKESLWVVVGQFFALAGSFALVRVMTSLLSPNQYGELALSLTALGLISQIAINSIGASIARYYPVAVLKNQLKTFASVSKGFLLISAVLSLTIGLIISGFLLINNYQHWAILCLLGFIFATLSLYNFTANSLQNAARNRSTVALHTTVESWLKIAAAFIAILLLGAQASSALIGYCLTLILLLFSQKYFLSKILNKNEESQFLDQSSVKNWQKNIWQYAWPFATWGAFTWAQQVSDLWSLKFFTSTSEVGLYTVVFQLGFAPIVLLNTVVQQFLSPILNQHATLSHEGKKKNNVHLTIWVTAFLSLIVTTLTFIFVFNFHEWLFSWLVAAEYRSASVYLAWMLLAGGVFSAGQILSLKLMSEFKSKEMIRLKIYTALLGISFNIAGAWLYGTKGVIGSVVIFSFSYSIWMAWLTWQKQR